MLNFDFIEKGLRILSPPHFVYDFSRKCFSSYIILTDQISLSDCLYFLRCWGNICIVTDYFPGCDIINFETNIIFLIKPYSYLTKKSRQRFKYLENEKSIKDEIKSIHFYRPFNYQKLSQT